MALPSVGNVARPLSRGYGLRVNDLYLRLAVTPDTPIERSTAPRQPQRVDTRQTAEDFISDDYAVVFSRNDVSGGEGLDFAHSRNNTPLDITRFWDSVGIDTTPQQAGQLSYFHLLHDIINIHADADYVSYLGNKVFFAQGDTLNVTSNIFNATPTISTESPHVGEAASTITDLLQFNGFVYASVLDGVHRTNGDGTWTHFSDEDAEKLWGVKGRIIGSDGITLVELKSGAGSTVIQTLDPAFEWTDVVEAGPFILASATDGTIYAFTFDEETLATAITSRTSLVNEYPTTLAYRAGILLVGTAQETQNGVIGRLYTGQVADDGTVQLALIRQWGTTGTTIDYTPHSLTITRDYAYFSVYEGTRSHVWKYDFTTAGLFRNLGDEGLAAITDIIIFKGGLLLAADGLYLESDEYVTDGYLISPLADFLSPESKAWVGVSVDTKEIEDDSIVTAYFSTNPAAILDADSSSWVKGQEITVGRDTSYRTIQSAPSRYAALKISLSSSSDKTVSPYVNSFAIKAYPGASDVILRIPINVSDNVEFPHHRKIRVPGYGTKIYSYLKDIQDSAVEVELLKPREFIRGIIEEVSDRIPSVSHRGSPTFVTFLTVRGRRVSSTGTSESSASLGIGSIGIISIGGHTNAR